MKKYLLFFAIIISINIYAQNETNYDESKIPEYKLPDILVSEKGKKITNSRSWIKKRRPEIVSLFEENIYGKVPGELKLISYKVVEESKDAFNGKAIRKQVALNFKNNGKELNVGLLIYLPKIQGKVPVFVSYNFWGNHTVADDPEILLTESWISNSPDLGRTNNRVTEQSRGAGKKLLSVEKLIDAGYGLATMFAGDVDPDKGAAAGPDYSDGVHPLFYRNGQTEPLDNEWRTIAAWAWGLSRALDYFEKDDDIDQNKVIVFGHSRHGKAALWAGALDWRFAMVISNNSGCGGAALSRRQFGERLAGMNAQFPHWLCGNSKKYDYKEATLPVDQHDLIALIAPRPVYIASAEEDLWADPKGEFLSAYHATPVYGLFGKQGILSPEMPEINQPVMTSIGYHIRSGGHSVTEFDWNQYIKFANIHLK
jgi:hypothetical protein